MLIISALKIIVVIILLTKTRAIKSESPFKEPPDSILTSSANQISEVEKLKSELKLQSNPIYISNQDQIKEISDLRSQLSNAIQSNQMVKGINPGASFYSKPTIFKQSDVKNHLGSQMIMEFEGWRESREPSTFYSRFMNSTHMWHPPDEEVTYREALRLNAVTENLDFDLGENVTAWKSLVNKTTGKRVLVGLTNDSIILVSVKVNKFKLIQEFRFKETPSCFDVLERWNRKKTHKKQIVVVNIGIELIWLILDDNFESLSEIWKWELHKKLVSIQFFQLNGADMVVVVSEVTSSLELTSADIYHFDLIRKDFYLAQLIVLQFSCSNFAAVDAGRFFFLSFPQNDTAVTYRYESLKNFEGRFQHFMNISSVDVSTVVGFKMGGYSYLAVGGESPEILRYSKGTFVPQTILSTNFGLVEQFLPVPVVTHRDDLFLLVQHRIDFSTHSLAALDALLWDGSAFQPTLSFPCHIGNETYDFGITCMLDYDLDKEGIYGTAILQNGKNLSLLVPRYQSYSGLFDLDLKLSRIVDPIQDDIKEIQIIYDILEMMIKEEDESIKDLHENFKIQANDVTLNENVNFNEILINNEVWTPDDTEIDVPTLRRVLEEIDYKTQEKITFTGNGIFDLNTIKILPKEKRDIKESLILQDLVVENIKFTFVNGIPASELIFFSEHIDFNGDVIFENSVNVLNDVTTEFINGSPMESQTSQRSDGNFGIENSMLRTDRLQIGGNLFFNKINGILWSDFIPRVIFRNINNHFNNLDVNGEIVYLNGVNINHINNLRFPDDYLMTHGPRESIVSGVKTFQTLTTNAIDCDGTIDGINPFQMITLSGNETISGETVFEQVEVTESFNHKGLVIGQHLNDFLPNPSILQSKVINSTCQFKNLEVRGSIFIKGNLNKVKLDDLLSNVVYTNDPNVVISSRKTFQNVSFNGGLFVTSNLVNGIDLDTFLTKSSEQVLDISLINGNVSFGYLEIDGHFNGVNITELDLNSIKVSGDQFTEAVLIFNNPEEAQLIDIHANEIRITETYNSFKPDDLILTTKDFVLRSDVVFFKDVLIDQLELKRDLTGSGVFNKINLENFDRTRFSISQPQEITGSFYIKSVRVLGNLDVKKINEIEMTNFLENYANVTNIQNRILNGDILIENLRIIGNAEFNRINDVDFAAKVANAIYLNQTNNIIGDIRFLDEIQMNEDLIVLDNMNKENFNSFIDDLVRRNPENNIKLEGTRYFTKGIHVFENIETRYLNGIEMKKLLVKNPKEPLEFHELKVHGNLRIRHLNLKGYLNETNLSFLDSYTFDEENQAHVIKAPIEVNQPMTIQFLHIKSVNGVPDVSDHLGRIVKKNEDTVISGDNKFTGKVYFSNGFNVADYNGINVPKFMSEVVYIDESEYVIIKSDVVFLGDVEGASVSVEGDFITDSFMGCDPEEWIRNGLRIDRGVNINVPLYFMPGTFSGFDLNVTNLNGHPMSSLITLHTEQSFTESLNVDEVYTDEPIDVGGYVNGINLDIERSNTLFLEGNQIITGNMIFKSVEVLGDLEVNNKVNGKDFNNLAYLQNDLYFKSPIKFKSVKARNVEVADTISGIKFEYWYDYSVWCHGKDHQIITGNWEIENLIIRGEAVGNGLVNNIHIQQMIDEIYKNRTELVSNLEEHLQETKKYCYDVKQSAEQSKEQIYFLKYFENSFTMSSNDRGMISSKYFFKHLSSVFLVISSGCLSEFFVWNTRKYFFDKLFQLETGFVNDWISLPELDSTFLVSNSNNYSYNCRISGSNIWKLSGNNLEHISQISNSEEFKSIHKMSDRDDYFYVFQNTTIPKITELDISGSSTEEWKLSPGKSYRFVPDEANIGLALSDGRKISILNSIKNRSRIKRTFLKRHNGTALKQKLEEIRRQIRSRLEKGPLLTIPRMNQNQIGSPEKAPIFIRPFPLSTKIGSSKVGANGKMEVPVLLGNDNASLFDKLLTLASNLLERSIKELKTKNEETIFENPRITEVGLSRKVQQFNERMNKYNSSLADESDPEEVGVHVKRKFKNIKRILRKSVPKLLLHVFKITMRLASFVEMFVGSKQNQTFEDPRYSGIINEFIKNGTDVPSKIINLTTKMEGVKRSLEENDLDVESNDTQKIDVPVGSPILTKLVIANKKVEVIQNLKEKYFIRLLNAAMNLLEHAEKRDSVNSSGTFVTIIEKISDFNSRMESYQRRNNFTDLPQESKEEVGSSIKETITGLEDIFKSTVPRVLDQVFKITARFSSRLQDNFNGKSENEYLGSVFGNETNQESSNITENKILKLTGHVEEITDLLEENSKKTKGFEKLLDSAIHLLDKTENKNNSRTSQISLTDKIIEFNSRMEKFRETNHLNESEENVGTSIKESLNNFQGVFKNAVPRVLDQVFKITARLERFKENVQGKEENEYVGSIQRLVLESSNDDEIVRLTDKIEEIQNVTKEVPFDEISHFEEFIGLALNILEHAEKNNVTSVNASGTAKPPLRKMISNFNSRMKEYQKKVNKTENSEEVGISIKESLSNLEEMFKNAVPRVLDQVFKITARMERFKENFQSKDQSEYIGSVYKNDLKIKENITRITSQMKEINKLIEFKPSSINHSDLDRLLTSALTLLDHTEKSFGKEVNGNNSRTTLNEKIVEFNSRMRQLNTSEIVGISMKESLTDVEKLFQRAVPRVLDQIFKITGRLEQFKDNFKRKDSEYLGANQNDPMVGDPTLDGLTEVAINIAIKLAVRLGNEIQARLAKDDLIKPPQETVGSSLTSLKSNNTINSLTSQLDRINLNLLKHKSSKQSSLVPDFKTTEMDYTTTESGYSEVATTDTIAIKEEANFETSIIPTKFPELQIAKELPLGGVLSADNSFLPEHGRGEIVVLKVGSKWNRRTLIAVSSQKESIIVGNQDVIQIYQDVLVGRLFQTINCFKPSNLAVLQIRDETILAFLEDNIEVHILIYRGIQGFIQFAEFQLQSPASKMVSVTLPTTPDFVGCPKFYLVLTLSSELLFLEALMEGDCGVENFVNCDLL